jgi:phosphopantothenoylcysteine decarboxylase/phosphopantothenate--cysteine ligase
MNLKNKKIIVCVSGGIAAYKACELVRALIKKDAEVRVAMTKSATKFVTPLTMETLTNHEVAHEMFPDRFIATRHIDWADWADLLIFVPATANTIAKLAHGFSDDIITTITLAHLGKKLIAPAMNTNMWRNSIVQENIDKLKSHGFHIMGTSVGELACGWVGEGRLAELDHIMEYVGYALNEKPLSGKKVTINAGPTMEALDPVRFLSNHSSGKMGYALARAAWSLGADVTLISGPTSIQPPYEVQLINVQSAVEMLNASKKHFETCDIFIGSAAVADYRPKDFSEEKIKKSEDELTVTYQKNPDILKSLGEMKTKQKIVGFALETQDAKANALKKLKAKNLDAIVLNERSESNLAFGADTNTVTFISSNNEEHQFENHDKQDLAYELLALINKHV